MNDKLADLKLAKTPTPLATFLFIYFRAREACYRNYMEGAQEVFDWLSPIAIPSVPADYTLPLLTAPSYELVELAKVVVGNVFSNPDFDDWLEELAKMEYIIFTTVQNDSNIRKLL